MLLKEKVQLGWGVGTWEAVEQPNQSQQNVQSSTHSILVAGRDQPTTFSVCECSDSADWYFMMVLLVAGWRDEQVIVHCALWETGNHTSTIRDLFLSSSR